MMFERKQKNRRLNRVHVLDVKMRSDQVRKSRMRLSAVVLGALFGTLFGAYVLWRTSGWVLDQLVYENQAFAIKEVQVHSDGIIAGDQLRRWANVRAGENLLGLDLARVKRDLEMVPLIASASVERILPGTLRIRVTEREAVALVNRWRKGGSGALEAVAYHVDADGFVIAPLASVDDNLPVLYCANQNEIAPGRKISSPQTIAALNLISQFAVSPMAGLVDLQQIDATVPDVLVVKTGQGSEVTFALSDLERQLYRWREIYDFGMRMNRNVASIDLAVSNNVPVRWLEANVSPAPAKPAKTHRTRKRNV